MRHRVTGRKSGMGFFVVGGLGLLRPAVPRASGPREKGPGGTAQAGARFKRHGAKDSKNGRAGLGMGLVRTVQKIAQSGLRVFSPAENKSPDPKMGG